MSQSNIIMYTTEDGITKVEVTFEQDTVWLSIDQMEELFQRDKSVIGKHIRNIFKTFHIPPLPIIFCGKRKIFILHCCRPLLADRNTGAALHSNAVF